MWYRETLSPPHSPRVIGNWEIAADTGKPRFNDLSIKSNTHIANKSLSQLTWFLENFAPDSPGPICQEPGAQLSGVMEYHAV